MRVTHRVEDHIRKSISDRVFSKFTVQGRMHTMVQDLRKSIDERVDEYRKTLWKEAEEMYPELKDMKDTIYGYKNADTHPAVKAEIQLRSNVSDAVQKAVDGVIVSLELGAPATQLDALIDEACKAVEKYIEERTAKIVD